MNSNYFFISDIEEYNNLYKVIEECFYRCEELPNRVFREEYSNFLFQDFEFIMTPEFWTVIKDLSKKTNDEVVILGVLDPDPIYYHYNHFEYINWLKLPTDITYNQYIEQIEIAPEDSEADSIFYNSYIIAIVPISKKWCIWLDRSFDVCIIGFEENFFSEQLLSEMSMFKSVDYALNSWMSFILYKDDYNTNMIKIKFKKNYDY